jgi:hypothetical protein
MTQIKSNQERKKEIEEKKKRDINESSDSDSQSVLIRI